MAIYTTQTISGYNASPPSDDGAMESQNEATWSGIKTKIGDPVRTLAQDINTQLITSFATTETRLGNLVDSFNYTSALCPYKNLRLLKASASTFTVTADKLALASTSDVQFIAETVSETVDITTSGANGLDTLTEANSTWYHVFVIAKDDSTVDALISTSATAPTMPSGYIYKGYVGAIYNDSSGNIREFGQIDNHAETGGVNLVTNGQAGTPTSLNSTLTAAVPTTAKTAIGYAQVLSADTTAAFKWVNIQSRAASGGHNVVGGNLNTQTNGDTVGFGSFNVPLYTPQTIFYEVSAASTTKATITISGYTF